MRVLAAGVMAAAVAAACGSSSNEQPSSGNEQPDVRGYATLAQQISATASAYATADDATSDVPGCQSRHGAYDAQVRPMVERMRAMSGGMDLQMEMMGDAADADMMCGADAMMAELDR